VDARIRLGDRIGRGGMAEVFAAQLVGPAGFEKDVAVKRILPRYAHDPVFLERFLNEARLAARLSHPNIVQIFELGHDGNDHYIVMEAVRGKSLRALHDRVRELTTTIPRPVALHIAQSLCAGLAHADEQLGLIHRDVSPHNVLLSFDGAVKLIDFGIARVRSDDRLTQVGQVLGKLRYLAPEQVTGGDVDARADVFAVGVLLYEMLTNRLPFDGKNEEEIAQHIRDGKRIALRELVQDVEQTLVDVVDKALQIDRSKRFQSAREMGALLAKASAVIPNGSHDVERMMRMLFPDEVSMAWPVYEARADGAEHTASVGPAPVEITISSDVGLPEDRTLDDTLPKKDRRGLLIAGGAFVVTTAAGVAFLPKRTEAVQTPDAGVTTIVPVVEQSDAGFPGAGEGPEVVDAGAKNAADGLVPSEVRKKKKIRTGRLVVETRPWTKVKIDGKNAGVTPLAIEVSAGSHKLLLENDESGVRREVDVKVIADDTTTLRLDLRK
jgi:eukaryotic-like serine/threonine-protein kinase